ncbi:hypothetical protein [Streptomyces lydicamycinicus]|uniref:hypothetical protein n=1 Tax=Streptomyces lydicamycinicus TaxID=1546107 RepID=UPI003C2DA6FF
MSTSSTSPASAEEQPSANTDHLAWRRHLPALSSAATGIKRASDAWDDSFFDPNGWAIEEEGYADGKVKRDAEAWKHVEVFLAHGPEVLAGVRATASGGDYVEGPVSEDLRRLRGIDTTLERAGQLRHEWDQIMALMDASLPGSRKIYESGAERIRNADGWRYADELSFQGPALVRAADYLAGRADSDQPSRPNVREWPWLGPAPATAGPCPLRPLHPRRRLRWPQFVPSDAHITDLRHGQTGRPPDPHLHAAGQLMACQRLRPRRLAAAQPSFLLRSPHVPHQQNHPGPRPPLSPSQHRMDQLCPPPITIRFPMSHSAVTPTTASSPRTRSTLRPARGC